VAVPEQPWEIVNKVTVESKSELNVKQILGVFMERQELPNAVLRSRGKAKKLVTVQKNTWCCMSPLCVGHGDDDDVLSILASSRSN